MHESFWYSYECRECWNLTECRAPARPAKPRCLACDRLLGEDDFRGFWKADPAGYGGSSGASGARDPLP